MNNSIYLKDVQKTYKLLNRHEGMLGSIRDIFSRDYQYLKAVENISFTVEKGEILGLLGPNGSGKSTTIKMLTGILNPTAGEVLVDGLVPWKEREELTRRIGVVFGQRTQLWWSLPLVESLKVLKKIYRMKEQDYKDNLELFQSIVDLESLLLKPVRQMSLGQRTLCDIVASFLHNPSIVFLDEPTIGLDVVVKDKIRNLIKMLNMEKNTTIVITTHDMRDVEELCQNVVIIDKGKKIFHDRLTDIYSTYKNSVNICLLTDLEKISDKEMRIKKEFLSQCGITITNIDNDRQLVNVLVEEYERFEYKLNQITELLASQFAIFDMKILDTELESVIKKIYCGEYK